MILQILSSNHSGVDRLWGLYIAQMWYTIFFQYILTWKSLIHTTKNCGMGFGRILDQTLGIYQRNIGHITSPHVWMPILCAKKIRGSPSETGSNHSVAWSPNKNMAQPEFTKKCCDSWWLLGMIPWHQPVPNSSSFHENTSRIHLKIQKNQKKIQKPPFVRTKKTKNAIPRGPQV